MTTTSTETLIIARNILNTVEDQITPTRSLTVKLNIGSGLESEVIPVIIGYTKPLLPLPNTGFIDADPISLTYAKFFFTGTSDVFIPQSDLAVVEAYVLPTGGTSSTPGEDVVLTQEVEDLINSNLAQANAYTDSKVVQANNLAGSLATTAESNANAYADGVATTAESNANAYTDSHAPSSSMEKVQSSSDLTAIPSLELFDKKLAFVEDTNSIYAYDLQSVKVLDPEIVVASATGVGRWEKVVANTTETDLSGGNF